MSGETPEKGDKGKSRPLPRVLALTPSSPFSGLRILAHNHERRADQSKVSWNWHGSAPSGHVAEKKTEGTVEVVSKRGNAITRDAKPGDPAVAIERSGNDVVKNASELHVEEKKAKSRATTPANKATKASAATPKSQKKADEDKKKDDENEPETNGAAQDSVPAAETSDGAADAEKDADEAPAPEKKGRGRPKGTAAQNAKAATKEVKAKKPAGRPKKQGKKAEEPVEDDDEEEEKKPAAAEKKAPGKRGRPAKDPNAAPKGPAKKKAKKDMKPERQATRTSARLRAD